jgi:hypothetical protein
MGTGHEEVTSFSLVLAVFRHGIFSGVIPSVAEGSTEIPKSISCTREDSLASLGMTVRCCGVVFRPCHTSLRNNL